MTAASLRLALRTQTPGDNDFLARLYASTRSEELRHTGWTDSEKQTFLDQQFRAQTLHYENLYRGARRAIVLFEDKPAGRLYLFQMNNDLRIVDISLLSEYRGRGIGTALLRGILERAQATGSKVSIHVEIFNPAKRLYERLGFVPAAPEGVYLLMEWRPERPIN
jgi:ribosomal protein S18 acetylase RimI-like enzyme